MEEEHQTTKRNIIGILGCIGGLIFHFIVGSPYQWGIINIYVASYYRLTDSSVTLETSAIAFPILIFVGSLMITPGIYIAEKTNPLAMLTIISILQAGCVFASSYMTNIWGFMVMYGLLFGIISTSAYMVSIVQCNKYFPGKRTLVNGFILIGTGVGSLVFGMFSYNFLNPNKLPHNKGYYLGSEQLQNIARKVPECLRWLSLMQLIFGLLSVALLWGVCRQNHRNQNEVQNDNGNTNKPKQNSEQNMNVIANDENGMQVANQTVLQNQGLQLNTDIAAARQAIKDQTPIKKLIQRQELGTMTGAKVNSKVWPDANNSAIQVIQVAAQPQANHESVVHGEPTTVKQALCSCVFWMGIAVLFLGVCGPSLINVNFKTYARLVIADDQFLTIIGIVAAIGNGISRIVWNYAFTKVGYKFILMICIIIEIIVFSSIRFTLHLPGLYLVLVCLVNCCFGGFISLTSAYCNFVYGHRIGSKVFGICLITTGCATFAQFGLVLGLSPIITIDGVIYIVLGMAVINFFIILFYKFQGPWQNSLDHLGFLLPDKKE